MSVDCRLYAASERAGPVVYLERIDAQASQAEAATERTVVSDKSLSQFAQTRYFFCINCVKRRVCIFERRVPRFHLDYYDSFMLNSDNVGFKSRAAPVAFEDYHSTPVEITGGNALAPGAGWALYEVP